MKKVGGNGQLFSLVLFMNFFIFSPFFARFNVKNHYGLIRYLSRNMRVCAPDLMCHNWLPHTCFAKMTTTFTKARAWCSLTPHFIIPLRFYHFCGCLCSATQSTCPTYFCGCLVGFESYHGGKKRKIIYLVSILPYGRKYLGL